jgi:hypothetical protein
MKTALMLCLLVPIAGKAMAHEWYSDYKQPNGFSSCCGGDDCGAVPAGAIRYDRATGITTITLKPGEHSQAPEGGVFTFDQPPTPAPDGMDHACIRGKRVLCAFQGGAS